MTPAVPLILASTSPSRQQLLRAAGLVFTVVPSGVDEQLLKQKGGAAAVLASELASAKAAAVARQYPHALVIGADQILVCEGRLFDKPIHQQQAYEHLQFLRGKMQTLYTAVAVYQDEHILWRFIDASTLTMRAFSDEFLTYYLQQLGDAATTMVGACPVEGFGMNLLASVSGDYTAILGLPMLPLLEFLRGQRVLPV